MSEETLKAWEKLVEQADKMREGIRAIALRTADDYNSLARLNAELGDDPYRALDIRKSHITFVNELIKDERHLHGLKMGLPSLQDIVQLENERLQCQRDNHVADVRLKQIRLELDSLFLQENKLKPLEPVSTARMEDEFANLRSLAASIRILQDPLDSENALSIVPMIEAMNTHVGVISKLNDPHPLLWEGVDALLKIIMDAWRHIGMSALPETGGKAVHETRSGNVYFRVNVVSRYGRVLIPFYVRTGEILVQHTWMTSIEARQTLYYCRNFLGTLGSPIFTLETQDDNKVSNQILNVQPDSWVLTTNSSVFEMSLLLASEWVKWISSYRKSVRRFVYRQHPAHQFNKHKKKGLQTVLQNDTSLG